MTNTFESSGGMSRRGFIHCAACAAAASSLSFRGAAFAAAPGSDLEKFHEFPYGAVRLTGGRIKQHFEHIHAHYLAFDNDRILKVARTHE